MHRTLSALLVLSSIGLTPSMAAQQPPVFKLLYSAPLSSPIGEPTQFFEVKPGLFYGLTVFSNGTYGGVVYSITSSGQISLVYGLPTEATAFDLVESPDGLLWGSYGTGQNQGNYFSMTPNGENLKTYPDTVFGAPGNVTNPAPQDALYEILRNVDNQTLDFVKIDSNGVIASLHEFAPNEGSLAPFSPMVRNRDGNFYGVALSPYTNPATAWIYKLTPQGTYTKFMQFAQYPPTDSYIALPLTATLDGYLYGAIGGGGVNNTGLIYKVDPQSNLAVVASFPATGMNAPQSLMQASDGNLYGSTNSIPSYIFRLVRATNKLEQLYEISPGQGICQCVLIQGMDGKLYGTATIGGKVGLGSVFSLDVGLPPPTPVVTQVTPPAASPGTSVLLWGRYLLGATSVSFNGVPATSVSPTSVQSVWARVPDGATTGPITITTANGSFTTTGNFTVQ